MVRLVRRARERPADPDLFVGLSHATRYCGLLQASIAAAEQARRLDPAARTSVVHTYFMRGDYEKTLELAVEPYIRGIALAALGRTQEAIDTMVQLDESVPSAPRQLHDGAGRVVARRLQVERRSHPHDDGHQRSGRALLRCPASRPSRRDDRSARPAQGCRRGRLLLPPGIRARSGLDALRSLPGFSGILRDVEARHRRAIISFITAEGDRVLGLTSAV